MPAQKVRVRTKQLSAASSERLEVDSVEEAIWHDLRALLAADFLSFIAFVEAARSETVFEGNPCSCQAVYNLLDRMLVVSSDHYSGFRRYVLPMVVVRIKKYVVGNGDKMRIKPLKKPDEPMPMEQ